MNDTSLESSEWPDTTRKNLFRLLRLTQPFLETMEAVIEASDELNNDASNDLYESLRGLRREIDVVTAAENE